MVRICFANFPLCFAICCIRIHIKNAEYQDAMAEKDGAAGPCRLSEMSFLPQMRFRGIRNRQKNGKTN